MLKNSETRQKYLGDLYYVQEYYLLAFKYFKRYTFTTWSRVWLRRIWQANEQFLRLKIKNEFQLE